MSEQTIDTKSSKTKAKKPTGTRQWTEQLDVKMTEKELAELAPRIDSAIAEVEVLEEQKKSAALVWKSKIELAEERVRELRVFAASGKKKADVKVEERVIFETNSAEVWRLDTNEKIRFRALGLDERQASLPGVDASSLRDDIAAAVVMVPAPKRGKPGEPLTATVGEIAGGKAAKRNPEDVVAGDFGTCPKESAKGERCTRAVGHRGAHGYASKDGAS